AVGSGSIDSADVIVHRSLSLFHYNSLVLFFSFMRPPPPTPTLFPYTTLFRSRAVPAKLDEVVSEYEQRLKALSPAALAHAKSLQDRKSTRLNSSHVAISYAVFCLKKKKYA